MESGASQRSQKYQCKQESRDLNFRYNWQDGRNSGFRKLRFIGLCSEMHEVVLAAVFSSLCLQHLHKTQRHDVTVLTWNFFRGWNFPSLKKALCRVDHRNDHAVWIHQDRD